MWEKLALTEHNNNFTSNGTMNDTIDYDKTGEYVSISKGNNLTFDQGHAVMKTKDGETEDYTFIEVFNGTDFQGASVYSTNSTGKLSVWIMRRLYLKSSKTRVEIM